MKSKVSRVTKSKSETVSASYQDGTIDKIDAKGGTFEVSGMTFSLCKKNGKISSNAVAKTLSDLKKGHHVWVRYVTEADGSHLATSVVRMP